MSQRTGPSVWKDITAHAPSARGLLPLVVGLLAWQAIQSGVTNSPYFPPPSAWWRGLTQIAASGRLTSASLATIETILLGLMLSAVLGATLGVVLGSSRFAQRALGPLLEFCRAMPPPAIVPLAILFLGYDERMKLTIVAISAMWPILLNTAAAVEDVHPILMDVASSFRLSTWERIRLVIFPSAVPAVLLGLRVALPLTIVLTILVEILTSIDGVGALMIAAQRNFHSAQVYGLLAYVGLFGFMLNNALALIEAMILRRWPPQSLTA